jgi:hypothetical protein
MILRRYSLLGPSGAVIGSLFAPSVARARAAFTRLLVVTGGTIRDDGEADAQEARALGPYRLIPRIREEKQPNPAVTVKRSAVSRFVRAMGPK